MPSRQEAGALWQKVLTANPDHLGGLMGMGGLALENGRHGVAAALFLRALSNDPGLFAARRSLGNALILQGLYDEAVDLFRAGVDLQPQNLEAHYYLGKAYMKRGLIDDAEAEFEYVARSDSTNQEAYLELLRIYALRDETQRAYNALRGLINLGFTDAPRILNDSDFQSLTDYAPAREMLEAAASGTDPGSSGS